MNDLGPRSVAVVGGGAAGISAAFWLQRAGHQVRVYEAGERVGGRCVSIRCDGFVFDLAAGALPATYGETRELIRALGLESQMERRGAVVGTLRDGVVHRIDRRRPWSMLGAQHLRAADKVALWRFGRDLARMYRSLNYADMSSAARFDTETVAAWAQRNFDASVVDNFVSPLSRALFLVEPDRTSVVDFFAAAKSLLVAGHLMTHPDGVGFFLDAAASALDVVLGAEVTEVKEAGDGVTVRGADFEDRAAAAVIALPAAQTVAAYPDLDPVQRVFLDGLEYSASIVVNLGVGRRPDERSSMVLIPRDVHPDLPVVGLGHNLGPGRAPAGKGVLTAFWMEGWSRKHWGDGDEQLVERTAEAINGLLPGWADAVETSVVSRWDPSLVVAAPGTYERLAQFVARVDPGARVQLAGDYLAQSSVNASVAAGKRAAERLAAIL
ncbi:MAG TPA: FAD-dependent oxidoreductase [Acidimicrobiales bacterium]|nr:FAD-dependent oxidoreductase [Acidimicrobiales bacterium]